MRCGIREEAQCSQYREAATLGFATTVSFIHEQRVGRKLLRQRDRCALAGVETLINQNEIASRALNVNPLRQAGNPPLYYDGCLFPAEFSDNSRRDEHTTVESGKDVAMFDKDQIPQRTGVSDDDHN